MKAYLNSFTDGSIRAYRLGLYTVGDASMERTMLFRKSFMITGRGSRMLRLRGDRTKIHWCPMRRKCAAIKGGEA